MSLRYQQVYIVTGLQSGSPASGNSVASGLTRVTMEPVDSMGIARGDTTYLELPNDDRVHSVRVGCKVHVIVESP